MEGIVNIADSYLKKSLLNISKLSDDIVRMESEINRLKTPIQVHQQTSVSDEEESFSDYPTSPLIGRRCQRVVKMDMCDIGDTAPEFSSSQEY